MAFEALRARAALLKREVLALWYALRHPGTPLGAKLVATLVVAYAVSPIDLIPDFIPVLGLLDDLILIPMGIALSIRLIPAEVLAECREQARASSERPRSYAAAAVIVVIWVAALAATGLWLAAALGKR
jgi:uncharacterized membrane protein YkvA (DUF1232 family)